jgi:hypothetical protein
MVLQFGRGLTKIFTAAFQRSRDREMADMRHARLRDRTGRRKIAPLPETAGGNPMQSKAQIDQILREKSEAKEIPGVVAIAARGNETIYQGAFGKRDGRRDDARQRVLDCIDDQGGHHRGRDATRRAGQARS